MGYVFVKQSRPLIGEVSLSGAKNAALVIMASLLLTRGKSILRNIPALTDVYEMILILKSAGAIVEYDAQENILNVDTTHIDPQNLNQEAIRKFRASILILGPILAQYKEAKIAMPGGCAIGARPVDYHIKNFQKLGAEVWQDQDCLYAKAPKMNAQRLVLDYPSVGATENLLMALTLVDGESWIVNAALEPEVLDLITVLQKMGACIEVCPPAMIKITGVSKLNPVDHSIISDRLEAGSLLIASSITKGDIFIPNANAYEMELFLMKLEEMGHTITVGKNGEGVRLKATKTPRAVSFKTGPYPGFPTDLQALMMAAQTIAQGNCNIVETVFENRFMHIPEMNKMGAKISATGHYAQLEGVQGLVGTDVIATDLRAACALVLLGLAADGETRVQNGVHHWKRGYETLDEKLRSLGAFVELR
ncbi:MAG: UDP-N-acetylglucosamine 1-carboxyvinyltransferase [Candidatus Dependentiae bacterium]|nr:UDP-N-acetylglucosamine 1-carboxyvinyltransferase [Candidatus Dependentiae bacterium]